MTSLKRTKPEPTLYRIHYWFIPKGPLQAHGLKKNHSWGATMNTIQPKGAFAGPWFEKGFRCIRHSVSLMVCTELTQKLCSNYEWIGTNVSIYHRLNTVPSVTMCPSYTEPFTCWSTSILYTQSLIDSIEQICIFYIKIAPCITTRT